MAFLGSANYSPGGTTFTWQSGRKSHVHEVPPSPSFKSNYKLHCHICDRAINRGDWATRVSEHWLSNPYWCQPGVTLRAEAFTPNKGTCQMSKFTGCRIVHRDCCCSESTHGTSVFTLQQWADIWENEDHGTPYPAARWPEAERIWEEVVQEHKRDYSYRDSLDHLYDSDEPTPPYDSDDESEWSSLEDTFSAADTGGVYVLRAQLAEELRYLCGKHGHLPWASTRSYRIDYPDGCPWQLRLFIAAQP